MTTVGAQRILQWCVEINNNTRMCSKFVTAETLDELLYIAIRTEQLPIGQSGSLDSPWMGTGSTKMGLSRRRLSRSGFGRVNAVDTFVVEHRYGPRGGTDRGTTWVTQ